MYVTVEMSNSIRIFRILAEISPSSGIPCSGSAIVSEYIIPVASGTAARFARRKWGAL